MTVYVVSAKSESGDDYGPWVFDQYISKKDLKKFLQKQCPDEFEGNGPGDYGSYLYITSTIVDMIEIKSL